MKRFRFPRVNINNHHTNQTTARSVRTRGTETIVSHRKWKTNSEFLNWSSKTKMRRVKLSKGDLKALKVCSGLFRKYTIQLLRKLLKYSTLATVILAEVSRLSRWTSLFVGSLRRVIEGPSSCNWNSYIPATPHTFASSTRAKNSQRSQFGHSKTNVASRSLRSERTTPASNRFKSFKQGIKTRRVGSHPTFSLKLSRKRAASATCQSISQRRHAAR